ncbi:MAG TPA: transporter substrate-binding domain-containing protein [Symbiobacteriaceae bacterium]
MKHFLKPIAAVVLALFVLAGCGGASQPSASDTPTLDRIKKEGKLVIGTSPDYPPFETLDENNNVVGFDIDVMQKVAERLGVELEIVQMDFNSLIEALKAGKFDIMAAGVTITDERKEVVDFSDPYIGGTDAVVARKDKNLSLSSLEDLKGMTVAVQAGTIHADILDELGGVNVKKYNLFTEAAAAVSAGQADAVFLHTVVAKAFIEQDPNLEIVLETPTKETAYALRKDTPDLTQFVNQVLADLKASGELEQLMLKWFK